MDDIDHNTAIEKALQNLLKRKAQGEDMLRKTKEFAELSKTDSFSTIYKPKHYGGKSLEDTVKGITEFIDALQNDLTLIEQQQEYLEGLKSNKYTLLKIPPTRHVRRFLTSKDKVSNTIFNGGLSEELTFLKMEGRNSKKELTAKVSINIDDFKNISISRELSPYDREVHDSIVSLCIDGENEYITPLMIYRTMTGNPKAKLPPKQQEAISESVDRCSFTRIKIDATDEAKVYGMDKAIYEGNLIYTEKVTVQHNGEINEWIHLLREPILFDYASSKNQIGRLDIKLLNTPTNKNEEVIILQGYLQRRILTMKGSNMSRNIVYDTVYRQLSISGEASVAKRKKEKKIRDFIEVILNYWKQEKFILGFIKNGTKSLSIEL